MVRLTCGEWSMYWKFNKGRSVNFSELICGLFYSFRLQVLSCFIQEISMIGMAVKRIVTNEPCCGASGL